MYFNFLIPTARRTPSFCTASPSGYFGIGLNATTTLHGLTFEPVATTVLSKTDISEKSVATGSGRAVSVAPEAAPTSTAIEARSRLAGEAP